MERTVVKVYGRVWSGACDVLRHKIAALRRND